MIGHSKHHYALKNFRLTEEDMHLARRTLGAVGCVNGVLAPIFREALADRSLGRIRRIRRAIA